MKKIAILLIFVMTAGMLMADDIAVLDGNTATTTAKTIIVYDPIKHTETASNIFMAWAGLSLGTGILASTSSDPTGRGIGAGNIIYGVVETVLAIININYGDKITDPEKARLKMVDDCGWRAWSGLGHLVSGVALILLGNTVDMRGKGIDMKGVGVAMALQGSFIAISNTMNYEIARDPKNIRNWNAGIEIRFPLLASASF